MRAEKISIEKAKKEKLFYFVANTIVYRDSDKRCLILKRSEREIAHPGRYGVIGGKLEWNDMPVEKPDHINGDVLDYNDMLEKLIAREAMEEAGVEIYRDMLYINSKTFIRPDEVPTVMIKFTSKYKSGDVILEDGAFTDHAWVNEEEVKDFNCIDGIQEEVAQAIKAWNK
jgi:8-oxo-dGTP pyrophosphatase MutT (NUDIX family)